MLLEYGHKREIERNIEYSICYKNISALLRQQVNYNKNEKHTNKKAKEVIRRKSRNH